MLTLEKSIEINIVSSFTFINDIDWYAIDLYTQYSKTHKVTLWSQSNHPLTFKTSYPINKIQPYANRIPSGGQLIICGTRTEIGHWYEQSNFANIVLIHNLLSPSFLYKALNRLTLSGKKEINILYVSEMVKQFAGLDGTVFSYIPSASRFQPNISPHQEIRKFTVGRISDDFLGKHHHSDPKLYLALVELGIRIRITGGTCLTPWLKDCSDIELLPMLNHRETAEVYSNIDCFYYRVPSTIKDPFASVVIEAMLSGLPVVCHRDVGSVDVIKHGVNGFIFDTTDEAIQIITSLKKNANLREEIGINAAKISF